MRTLSAQVEHENWVISIVGSVEKPYDLSYSEMLKMPSAIIEAELYCVDAPDRVLQQGKWKGITLKTVLEKAGLKRGAVKVAFYSADGFNSDLPIEDALNQNVIVAYEINGKAMPSTEVLPGNRLVVPGQWGYKWVQGIVKIEVLDYDFLGIWESRGYPDSALINRVQPVCQGSSVDPAIYLAFVIMAFAIFFVGRSHLKRKRLQNLDLLTEKQAMPGDSQERDSNQRVPKRDPNKA